MTADKVVDASALAAVAFLELKHASVQTRLRGFNLHAPRLLRFEMTSICLKKLRAYPANRDTIIAQFYESFDTAVSEHEVRHPAVLEIASQFKLSAYDASYLWLAKHLNCELVTLDARLESAARSL